MALQYSTGVRNAQLNAVTTTVGASAYLKLFTGSPPANCGTADSGTLVANIALPSTWMNGAGSGSMTLSGTWQTTNAAGTGTAGYFRLYANDATTCHAQGTVTNTGGGGDMTLDNASIVAGQTVNISTFTLSAGNA